MLTVTRPSATRHDHHPAHPSNPRPEPAHARAGYSRARPRRAAWNAALVSIALAVGAWLGATAPSVSPVTTPIPSAPAVSTTIPTITVHLAGGAP